MSQFLFELNKWSLMLELASIFVVYLCAVLQDNFRSVRSLVLIALLMVATSIIHLGLQSWSGRLTELYPTEYYDYQVWYLGMGLCDFLFVFLCVAICKKYNFQFTYTGFLILVIFMIKGSSQIARYLDRVTLDLDVLGSFYSSIIPSLNSVIVILCVLCAIKSVIIALAWIRRSEKGMSL